MNEKHMRLLHSIEMSPYTKIFAQIIERSDFVRDRVVAIMENQPTLTTNEMLDDYANTTPIPNSSKCELLITNIQDNTPLFEDFDL